MEKNNFLKTRIYFTAIISIAIWSLLAWNHTHGGVPSHHILNKKDLPEISNWWGGILLPLLAWFVGFRIQKRENLIDSNLPKKVIYGFLGGLLIGILIATLFTFDFNEILGYLLPSILLIALFYPMYRAECLLGFVLGMTLTFGAVLPTAIGTILCLIGFIIFGLIRPAVVYLLSFLKGSV